MEEKKYKQLIYISNTDNGLIEKVCSNEKVTVVNKFTGDFSFSKLLSRDIKVLNNLDFLVIDVESINKLSDENEIINCLTKIKDMYNTDKPRIIFIAQGYMKGNTLLSRVFNTHICNIITSTNDIEFEEDFKKTISNEGMTTSNARKYQIDDSKMYEKNGKNASVIKEIYLKQSKDVSIGVVGSERHIGCTTQALNITRFLSEFNNVKPCYIENNNHNSIITIKDDVDLKDSVEYYENIGKLRYDGLDLFTGIKNVGGIKNFGYTFYIYDFGSIDEMSDNDISNFLDKDIKIIVSGSKPWESEKLITLFNKIDLKTNIVDENMYFVFNFIPDNKKDQVLDDMGKLKSKTLIAEYQVDPFEVKNRYFYNQVFKKFLNDTSYEVKVKNKGLNFKFKSIFKRKE